MRSSRNLRGWDDSWQDRQARHLESDTTAAGAAPTGRETEQDIEVPLEEIVQEYLQGLKIVERLIDKEKKACSATAVILKNQIQPKPAPDRLEPTPTVI